MEVAVWHRQEGPEVDVRGYRHSDDESIVEFLSSNMEWPAACINGTKLDYWRWKFLSNPLGFHLLCVAEIDGKIVSHCASIPVRMNVVGKEVLASQGVDLFTHPAHRGHGLIGQVMECRNRIKEEHDIAFDFGFPNRAAYQLSLTKHGFRDMGIDMMQYRYITDQEQFFRKVRFGPLKKLGYTSLLKLRQSLAMGTDSGADLTVGPEERFSDEATNIYLRERERFDLISRRDADYLNWRYCDPRSGGFLRRAVREGTHFVGYAIYKIEEREGTRYLNIVDLLVEGGRTDALASLLMDSLEVSRQTHAETVLCCLPKYHPYGRSFQDLGFIAQLRMTGDMPMRMIWADRGLVELDVLKRGSPRCHVTLGDTDWL
ncbi:MAG: GNAT family N-acetyltransferase [Euryarchaeota archaeon]|nr:GNAT family N-acetyltransferase [Euryarchaeota archaeon]